MDRKEILENIIIRGKNKEVIKFLKEDISNGSSPEELIEIMIGAMQKVGDEFQDNTIQISDMFSSAMTMKKGITYVTPLIREEDAEEIGTAIVGMAAGDLHDIGKNLVILMMESIGFKVIDLGIDVSPATYAESIQKHPDCKIVTISATLDSTVPSIKKTIELLTKEGLRSKVKIIVGGTPITEEIAKTLGADAFAETAATAALIAKDLLN